LSRRISWPRLKTKGRAAVFGKGLPLPTVKPTAKPKPKAKAERKGLGSRNK